MTITRRDFGRAAALLAAGLAQLRAGSALAGTGAEVASGAASGGDTAGGAAADHMAAMPAHWVGDEQITMLAYPGMTALDLVGPQYCFAGLMGATVRVVTKDGKPFVTDTGLTLTPDGDFASCPEAPDLLFVGGGAAGTLAAMRDPETLDFLAAQGAQAGLVTSVCTGSLLLGAAGLLKGYWATTHWAAHDQLAHFGATPVDVRVVTDRNRITAAGISAGIDLGLVVAARLRDTLYAQCLQLGMEYAPAPPFKAGTPHTAPREAVEIMTGMYTTFRDGVAEIASARKR